MINPSNDWEAPIPLGAFNLPKWPDDVFPEKIQKYVNELAQSTETPIELAALSVLAVISAAAQGKYQIQVKSDYFEPINIWTCVALPSGSRKSAVLNAVTKPLVLWEQQKKGEIEPQIAKIISENKTLEVRIKEMRRKAATSKEEEFEIFNFEILQLESEIKKVTNIPQIWTSDVTPENLGVIMDENNEKMAVISDEAGIFDILAGRYSSGIPNLDIFLQGHAGSPVRVNRGNRPPVFMERATLTLGLVPQPDVLKGLKKNPVFRGRGLLARFLFAIPVSNLGNRNLNTEPLSKNIQKQYSDIIMKLLNQDSNEPIILKFSKPAYEEWRIYALVIEVGMQDDGLYSHIRDWAGKLPGAVARIAGLLHLVRVVQSDEQLMEISETDVKLAIKIGQTLSRHALAAFDIMGADIALEGAKLILEWVKRNQWDAFTQISHQLLLKRLNFSFN